MVEWSLVQLEHVADVVGRGISPIYIEDDGVLVLNQKCVRDGRVLVEPARRHDALTRSIPSRKLLSGGEILINSTGVGTLGRTAFVGKIDGPMTADSHVTIVRAKSGFHPRWLGYAIRNLEPDIEALAIGSTGQTELGRSLVCGLPINMPPLAEQRAIAGVLGALDDKIESNRCSCALLDRIMELEYTASLGEAEEDFLTVAEPLLGGTPSRSNDAYWIPEVPWASAKDITHARHGVLTETFEEISSLGVASSAAKVLPAGTTIITARGTVGALARTSVPSAFSQSSYGLVPTSPEIDPLEVYWAARHSVVELKRSSHGTVFDTITKQTFQALSVRRPRVDLRTQTIAALQDYDEMLRAKVQENQTLAQFRDSLLPELLSGRLRVRDAESLLEGV